MPYEGSIELISGIKQKNGGSFPLVDSKDVRVTDEERLDEALEKKLDKVGGTVSGKLTVQGSLHLGDATVHGRVTMHTGSDIFGEGKIDLFTDNGEVIFDPSSNTYTIDGTPIASTDYVDAAISEIPVITVDSELSSTSTNAVQNKVIKSELDKKINANEDVISNDVNNTNTSSHSGAFYEATVASVDSDNEDSIPNLSYVNTALEGKLSKSGGDMDVDATIHFGMPTPDRPTGVISGLVEPTLFHEAANKKYVDDAIASIPVAVVDTELSSTSKNAVENKAIKAYVDDAIAAIPVAVVDTELSSTSTNAVQNKAIKAYVDEGLQEKANSSNPSTLGVMSHAGTVSIVDIETEKSITIDPISNSVNFEKSGASITGVGDINSDGTIYAFRTDTGSGSVTNVDSEDDTAIANVKFVKDSIPTVDSALSATSTNAVQNKAVYDFVNGLDQRLKDLEYKPIAINTFTVSPSSAEKGSSVSSVTISWSYNSGSVLKSQTLDNIELETDSREQSDATTRTADKTWTLSAKDSRDAVVSKTAKLSFMSKAHWGASLNVSSVSDNFILGLSENTLTTTRARNITVTAGESEYIWYAIPSSFGEATFTVGGFVGGFTKFATLDHTNSSGFTTSYDVYRSTNAGLGTTVISIS